MKQNKSWGNHSRRYHFFFSYIALIALILIFITVFVFSGIFRSLENKITEIYNGSLAQIVNNIDNSFKENDLMALNISSNAKYTAYALQNQGYQTYTAVNSLKEALSMNLFVKDIGIYYKDSSHVYSASGSYRADRFAQSRLPGLPDLSRENLLGDTISKASRYLSNMPSGRSAGGEGYITQITGIPYRQGEPGGYVFFFISELTLMREIESTYNNTDGYFLILDAAGDILFERGLGKTAGMGYADKTLALGDTIGGNVTRIDIDGVNHILLGKTSEYNGFRYVAGIAEDQFFGEIERTRNLFLLFEVLVICVSLVFAVYLSQRNFTPIKNLSDHLKKLYQEDAVESLKDEYRYLDQTFHSLVKRNHTLDRRVHSGSERLKANYLRELLFGLTGGKNDPDDRAVDFQETGFSVLLLTLPAAGGPVPPSYVYGIRNILEEVAAEYGRGYSVEVIEGKRIALIVNAAKQEGLSGGMKALAVRCRRLFLEHLDLDCQAAIGNIHDSPDGISASYYEAQQMAFYGDMAGGDRVVQFHEHFGGAGRQYHYPHKAELDLLAAISNGEREQAAACLHGILTDVIQKNHKKEMVQISVFTLLNAILKASGYQFALDEVIQEETGKIDYSRLFDLRQLEQSFQTIIDRIVVLTEAAQENRDTARMDELLGYVNGHFTDPELSLDKIAADFSLTPSYITGIFKTAQGQTLMNYIGSLRIAYAKKLLAGTDLPQKEIVRNVGFTDQNNFIRRFKAAEGITPSAYRRISRNQDEIQS